VNCAALPEALVESELFGHERGAFTGAVTMRKGAFEAAGKGTIFLDEIGELPSPAQAKLLRVLEEQTVTRVGATKTVPVPARVLAATNRDLETEVKEGRFREDLLYRLNVHVAPVPPLRDRLSDLPELVERLTNLVCARFRVSAKRVSPPALDVLASYDWARNNVRELRNVIERMVIDCNGATIGAEHVPADVIGSVRRDGAAGGGGTFVDQKAEAERRIIVSALERNEWHVTRTAAELGLADHASLLKIMRRHGLRKPDGAAR
jgi:transcriptional regulator with GAF, ATPase, and Fis domain